jgi:hypothetical protein
MRDPTLASQKEISQGWGVHVLVNRGLDYIALILAYRTTSGATE